MQPVALGVDRLDRVYVHDAQDHSIRRLAEKLGAQVAIQHGRGGKGKLVVAYNSIDELEGILGHIT